MSKAALPWLWGSLLLHAGLVGFCRPWGEVERLPRALQQVEFDLLAMAPPQAPSELQRPPTEAVPARAARELSPSRQSPSRQSAPRVLEPPQVQRLESRTGPLALEPSEPTASEGAAGAEAPPPIAVETPLAVSQGASDVPGPGRAQPSVPRGGSAGVGSAAAAQDLAAARRSYLRALRERVLARREYPHAAQRAGLQGTVCLRFSVSASGRLSRWSVTCDAAPEPLLQAALRAVHAAEPFGPLPSGLGSEVTVDLPMVFRLDAL